jgi:pyrroline-5-carboxylate reductase
MPLHERTLALVGGGYISEVILTVLLNTRTMAPDQFVVSDPRLERLRYLSDNFRVHTVPDNVSAVTRGDFVFINVLPHVVEEVISELASELPDADMWADRLIVTVAAGITMRQYSRLSPELPVVRALPNPQSQTGSGVIALAFNSYVSRAQKEEILALFAPMGERVEMEEQNVDVMTALSTPVNVYLFIQSMIDAGILAGLDRPTSTRIVLHTIAGSLEVWKRNMDGLDGLIDHAAPAGGVSEACLSTLASFQFSQAVSEAIRRGTERSASFASS